MTPPTLHCTACGGRDVTESHLRRCQVLNAERTAAVAYGETYDVPAVTTADLWAHLGHVASPQDATRIVRQLLDLGWRPVCGSDETRLWLNPTNSGPDAPSPAPGTAAASTVAQKATQASTGSSIHCKTN